MSTRAQFEKFLDDLAAVRVTRVVSIEQWNPDAGESVLVGRGAYNPSGSPPSPVLALNNKATKDRFKSNYTSLARLMSAPPPGFFDDWTLWSERPLTPAKALARITLVVEDASPDSVIGVLLLLMHLQGLSPSDLPADWIDAIDQWEMEGTVEDPRTSWTALASALAHRQFSIGKPPSKWDNLLAWTETLHFLAQCLRDDLHPYAIPDLPRLTLWRSAQAALRQEEQAYLGWLPHALQVQLSLPINKSNARRLLVDGLLFMEDQATGTAKVFYRNDRKRAPLGRGFGFAAHYRPSGAGTGNDFTISVDPRNEVNLKELWYELERREAVAWNGRRPSNKPRALETVDSKWNQPWYLKAEEDLIGAPRQVEIANPDGTSTTEPGTGLKWKDVQDAIWTVFNPVRNVTVHPWNHGAIDQEKTVALLDLRPVPPSHRPKEYAGHEKHLLLAKWPTGDGPHQHGLSPRALDNAPIVERVIASLIDRQDGEEVTLDQLPPDGAWQRIELSGGFAILTHDGLFVLDDWRERKLETLPEISEIFDQAASLDADLSNLETDEIEPLTKGMTAAVKAELSWKAHGQVMRHAAAVGVKLAEYRSREASIPREPDVRRIREALDLQWGLDRRLTSLEQQVKSITEALKTLGEARLLKVTRFVSIFAFAPYLASNLASPVSKMFLVKDWSSGPADDASIWLWLACFVVIAVVIGGVLYWSMQKALTKDSKQPSTK